MCSEHGDLTTCNKVPRISTEQRHAEVPSAPNGDTRCFPLTLCRYLFCVYQEQRYYASQITIHGKTNASGGISKESLLRMIQYSPCQRQAAAWGLVPAALQPRACLQERLGSRAAWCRGCVQQCRPHSSTNRWSPIGWGWLGHWGRVWNTGEGNCCHPL